jgi:hypothetical protein
MTLAWRILQSFLLLAGLCTASALDCVFSARRQTLGNFQCPSSSPQSSPKWTKSSLEAEAWKWAPILYHHPLEKHYLLDPAQWLEQSRLFDRFFALQKQNPGSASHLGEGEAAPWLYWSFASGLNSSRAQGMMRGAEFDQEGKSLARVWYVWNFPPCMHAGCGME